MKYRRLTKFPTVQFCVMGQIENLNLKQGFKLLLYLAAVLIFSDNHIFLALRKFFVIKIVGERALILPGLTSQALNSRVSLITLITASPITACTLVLELMTVYKWVKTGELCESIH